LIVGLRRIEKFEQIEREQKAKHDAAKRGKPRRR
jgi:hypothetical protein